MATITAELVSGGEKPDERGRKLVGNARREAIPEAYDRDGGMTQRDFARSERVSCHTLTTCFGWRRRESAPAKRPAAQFAEAAMPAAAALLEVGLPGGVIVRGQDVAQVAALIKALR